MSGFWIYVSLPDKPELTVLTASEVLTISVFFSIFLCVHEVGGGQNIY